MSKQTKKVKKSKKNKNTKEKNYTAAGCAFRG